MRRRDIRAARKLDLENNWAAVFEPTEFEERDEPDDAPDPDDRTPIGPFDVKQPDQPQPRNI